MCACFCCRSILRAPEKGRFRCTAKKSDLGPPSRSRCTSHDNKTAVSPPDISAFAYRPVKTVHSDQDGTTSKTKNSTYAPPDLGTFAYTPTPIVCPPARSKFTSTAMETAGSPPDLSTFAYYKPMKGTVRYSDGSRFRGTALDADCGTSWSQIK